MRASLKQEHGFGWSVREKQGKVQLTRRYEDGSRSSVTLAIAWDSRCLSEVTGLVSEIRTRMENQHMGLREACELVFQPTKKERHQQNWPEAIKKYEEHKVKISGQTKEDTFKRMYAPALAEVREIMSSKPKPTSGKELLMRIGAKDQNKPGTRWRRIKLQNTASFLRFTVHNLGATDRWLPPADLNAIIGRKDASSTTLSSTPLKDAQIVQVLAEIKDQRWRDAISLIACFGLRPVELLYCCPRDHFLYVSYRKQTARGMTDPGVVIGLDPTGMEGESQRLLQSMREGVFQLPRLGSKPGDVGESVHQHLSRKSTWQRLAQEIKGSGGRLTPYSFRHGYALRAHEKHGFTVRMTAKLMRHSVQTHCKHYGSWVDREMLDQAYEKSKKQNPAIT